MDGQTLEQEFAARIWSDLFAELLMLDPESIALGFVASSFLDGFFKEAGKLSADKFAPVFGRSTSNALPRIESLRAKLSERLSDFSILSRATEDPKTFRAIGKAILSSAEIESEESQEILADSIIALLKDGNPNSILSVTASECCSIIPKLNSRHLRCLGFYAVFMRIVPRQANPKSDEEFSKITHLVDTFASPLLKGMEGLSASDLRFLENVVGCLSRLNNVGFQPNAVDSSGNSAYRHVYFLGVNIPITENKLPPFWEKHSNIFVRNSFLRNYQTTMKGDLIGYLTLQYLSNYHGSFYGFEN